MDPLGGDGCGDGDMDHRGAGRGRGRGPWTSTSHEVHTLRRPHGLSPIQTGPWPEVKDVEQSKSEKSDQIANIIQNSTLSVHAAEFIPKSYPAKQPLQDHQPHHQDHHPQQMHHQQRQSVRKHTVQNRLQVAREIPLQQYQIRDYACSNSDVPQHYQQIDQVQHCDNFSQHQQQQQQSKQPANTQDYRVYDEELGSYVHSFENSEQENYLCGLAATKERLMSVIHTLILNPGRFTLTVPSLINNITYYLKSPPDFQELMKVIIQQSINEGNFRYSGARLCASIDAAISQNLQKLFRETLHTLCKAETESQAASWKEKDDHTEEEQKKCHGLILFLAELVIQMEHTTTFGLGDLLIQLIINILKKPAPNSVKNVCQALKLAGHTLEKGRGSRKEMENMMRTLTELVTAGRVDTHVGRMVTSVHQLRNGNWGHTPVVETTVETTESTEANEAPDEPVFYGPDGKVLTAEENKFLEDVADCTTNFDNFISLDEEIRGFEDEMKWISPEEIDEMDEAYEEFLKNVPNRINNQIQK